MLLKIFAGLCVPVAILIFASLEAALWVLPLIYVLCLLATLLLAAAFLFFICALVDNTKPQPEDNKFYRAAMYLYIELILQVLGVTIDTKGMEHIPTGRRFMVVCNHQSETDPAFIHHYFRKSKLAFLSKKEAAKLPVFGPMMHMTSCQMVNRQNDREAMRAIIKCIQMIKEDQVSVGVFPEGTRSRDGKVHHFRSGVFKIAQKAQVPIVVCTINGTDKLFHNLKRLKRTHIHFHAVEVIPAAELQDKTTVEIADRVYEAMIADLGEEFREIPS